MHFIGFIFIILLAPFWLMYHTFRTGADALLVSTKVYSDFGSLLPLIRYFPHGLNWPIQHPLFPGAAIRYHFLFYAPIGFLESLGLPLDHVLNISSALGFFSLLFLIYYLSRKIFQKHLAGVLAVILFLFNSSLSWLDFIQHQNIWDLSKLTSFVSFRPWNDSQIAAFWTLNIYTNQRHLGFSFAICLLIIISLNILNKKYLYLIGFLLGSLLFINQAGFLISLVFTVLAFLTKPHIRKPLLISFLGFLPWYFLYRHIFPLPQIPEVVLGYLSDRPLTISNFVKFWFYNYGLAFIILLPSLFVLPKKFLNLFISSIILFIIGNLFLLSSDLINNHKLFNFSFMIFGIFISGFLIRLPRYLSTLILLIICLGGIVDIFPVINDRFISIGKTPMQRYYTGLPKSSVILNSTWFMHPASLAGLPIYNGYSYFTWSYGYNQVQRERQTGDIYASQNLSELCDRIKTTPISHIEISPSPESFLKINYQLYNYLEPDYKDLDSSIRIFSVEKLCANT